MGFTKIKNVTNMTSRWMWLQNGENLKFGLVMPPLARSILLSSTDMNVPWCDSHDRANDGHGKWNDADGRPQKSFVMWQHDRWWKDNDRVRFSGMFGATKITIGCLAARRSMASGRSI